MSSSCLVNYFVLLFGDFITASDVITFSNQSRLLLKSTRPLDREEDGEILSVNIRVLQYFTN